MVVVSIIMAEENTLSILNTINIIIVVAGIMAEGTTVGEVTLTTVFIRVTVDTDTASDQVLAGFIRGIMLIHLSL